MIFKVYCEQFQQHFQFNRTPNMILKQEIDCITQQLRCNDATLATVLINGNIVNSDLTLEELNVGSDCQISLFLSYYDDIKFQLKDNQKQVNTISINIYLSILDVQNQLAQYFRTDYDVEIILNDQSLSKAISFSQLDSNKIHKYQIKVNLFIENRKKKHLLCFSVFDRISNIKQKIRKQIQIIGRFQIFYNDGIQLDTIENMEETIYSLQIQNQQILKIQKLQQISLKYNFNDYIEYFKTQKDQILKDVIKQINQKHKSMNNPKVQIINNKQINSANISQLEEIKEYLIEDMIEIVQNKHESILITMINYLDLPDREIKIVNIRQNLEELKNVIKKKHDKCLDVEFILDDNKILEPDSTTFQQIGFGANKQNFLYYQCVLESKKNEQLSQTFKQQEKASSNSIYFNKQNGDSKQIKDSDIQPQKKQNIQLDKYINHPEIIISQNYNSQKMVTNNYSCPRTEQSLLNDNELYKQELKTEYSNTITITFFSNKPYQSFQLAQVVQCDQNMVIWQTDIYQNLLDKDKTIIMKYYDRVIDIYKSFKDHGICDDSYIEVIFQSDDQQEILSLTGNKSNQIDENIKEGNEQNQIDDQDIIKQNAKISINIQFMKDGILRIENKIYNKETIKFSLIKKALLTEYQLNNNFQIMYKGKKIDLNSNISGIIQESECLFNLEEQENLNDKKLITVNLKMIPDESPHNQQIQVDQDLEISNLYNLVQQKLNQSNFTIFYDGMVIKNEKQVFIKLKENEYEEIEVLINDSLLSSMIN